MDASALVAIIAGEEDADSLADVLGGERQRLCSAMSVWETVAGLCRSYMFSVETAREHVAAFQAAAALQHVTIGEKELTAALGAYAQFGKGRHPAALNMGDCFAYACAKTHGAKLLYKGDDFGKTDLARAGD